MRVSGDFASTFFSVVYIDFGLEESMIRLAVVA
jgi:hypothetical protein